MDSREQPTILARNRPHAERVMQHASYKGIETPIGCIPRYEELKEVFTETINKEYPRDLYDKQFSIYVDRILDRINLQREAFGKGVNVPAELFQVYDEWESGLKTLKEKNGPIVTPDQLG